MEEGVVAWAVEVDEGPRSFARCFTRHGNGRLAAAEVGYKRPGVRAHRLLERAEVVVACLEEVELDRRNGLPLCPTVRRKLTASIARARKRGGATAESTAALPKLEQAVEEFRRHHGFEEREARAAPSLEISGAISTPGQPPGRLSSQGEVKGCEPGVTSSTCPVLPRWKLAPVFRGLRKPSRYKAVHGGRGSGKSHVFAELLVRRCVEAAPVRAVCI
ncbi:hypothetical protein FFK22_041185, partial [Mycobacterium sp. KBS0706]|uniref:hypothetical protein n=1 Tax=Mycobacterium sp. KBS0706 TaxID=2578109 RepID=UPI0011921AD6